jgi:hypothetical protein
MEKNHFTLYSKWDLGKNITFLASAVMLICLFCNWVTPGNGITIDQLKSMLDLVGAFGYSDTDVSALRSAYGVHCWRWILVIPMAYPVLTLFTSRYIKKYAEYSSIITIAVSVLMLLIGIRGLNAAAWIFAIASVVCFFGVRLSDDPALSDSQKPAAPAAPSAPAAPAAPDVPAAPAAPAAEAPAAPASPAAAEAPAQTETAEVLCPQCGAKNKPGSAFCSSCGAPLK